MRAHEEQGDFDFCSSPIVEIIPPHLWLYAIECSRVCHQLEHSAAEKVP